MRSVRVVVMCKAPIIGKVKTRLISNTIDAAQACALHTQMAEVVIRRAMHLFTGTVTIAADNPDHPFFKKFALPMLAQGKGDLGKRMHRIANAIIDHHALLFLGTDSPHMDAARLQQAVQLAQSHDAVAGPVEDGGYDLILLSNRNAMVLLDNVHWGSERVWQQTCQRAHKANLSLAALAPDFDVDCEKDLQRSQHLGWKVI